MFNAIGISTPSFSYATMSCVICKENALGGVCGGRCYRKVCRWAKMMRECVARCVEICEDLRKRSVNDKEMCGDVCVCAHVRAENV
jgi:hypothetical protein